MKTVKFRKKEYVIFERSELNQVVNETDFQLCLCSTYARSHKENPNQDLWRDFDMNQIMASAEKGRKLLNTLVCKEV